MKIIQDSIADLCDLFIELQNSFQKDDSGKYIQGCFFEMNIHFFKYEGDPTFGVENMYTIFAPEKEVGGTPIQISWNECLEELREWLSHPSFKREATVFEHTRFKPNFDLGQKRLQALLHEISKYFTIPPKIVYRYELDTEAWFMKDHIPHYCCYVFLSSGQGLVLNAFAAL